MTNSRARALPLVPPEAENGSGAGTVHAGKHPQYMLILEALPGYAVPEIRLRQALKLFRRAYNLKCREISQVNPANAPESQPRALRGILEGI